MTARPILGVVAALLVGLLSGCATVPISGPVVTAAPPDQSGGPDTVFLPNPPQDNMSPAEIVSGFITAASAGRDYQVAKEFLTRSFAASWRPNTKVLVHTDPWGVSEEDGDRVRLSVPTVAQVDADGRLMSTSAVESSSYDLVRVRGQWRINKGPNQVVLTERVFPQVFSSTALQFFDPSFSRLVPDVRWFPRRGNTPAAVVRALLGGQAPVLQEVTVPVFPPGTTLAAPVRTSAGVTTVAVDVPTGPGDERDTDRIQQALSAALGRSTASIRLVIDDRQAPVAPQQVIEQPSVSDPEVVAGGRFGLLNAQGLVSEDRELGPRIVQQDPTAVTISARQRLAAVRARDGRVLIVSRDRVRVADDRRDLAAPSLDQQGWTFSVPENEPGGLRVTSSTGERHEIASELDSTGVISIEVSTDGTRLLVLRRTSTGTEAYVAGILRSSDGRPIGLTTDRVVIDVDPATAAQDATWVDQRTVAVLTSNASVQNVVQQQVGGLVAPLGPLAAARTIVGAAGPQDLRALSGTGGLFRWSLSNATWTVDSPASVEISVLAVQR